MASSKWWPINLECTACPSPSDIVEVKARNDGSIQVITECCACGKSAVVTLTIEEIKERCTELDAEHADEAARTDSLENMECISTLKN